MKKLNTYIILLLFIPFFACKKDHSYHTPPVTSATTKYQLAFNLSAFNQKIIDNNGKLKVNSIVSDTGSLRALFDSLGYVVYDSVGTLVHARSFNAKTYTTNTIVDSLVPGKYKIAIYGGQTGIYLLNKSYITYGYSTNPANPANNFSGNPWKDTFEKTFEIRVNNANINQSVTLDRIVSAIELDVNDTIPAKAYSFNIKLSDNYFFYSLIDTVPVKFFSSQATDLTTTNIIIPDSFKGKPNFKFSYITLNTVSSFSFTVSSLTTNGTVVAQHVFDAVKMTENLKLVYSGNFFGTPSNSNTAFPVSVNPLWDPNPIKVNF
jgi:hypothetical protein